MSEELHTPEEEKKIEELSELTHTVEIMMQRGDNRENIVKYLTKAGISDEEANSFINQSEQVMEIEYKLYIKQNVRRIIIGILFAVGGTVLTLFSAITAFEGIYFAFYGAIIYGVIDIIRGIYGLLKRKKFLLYQSEEDFIDE